MERACSCGVHTDIQTRHLSLPLLWHAQGRNLATRGKEAAEIVFLRFVRNAFNVHADVATARPASTVCVRR